ncbi:hypothetical protein H257_14847 [Aphanomyces astaci]|uniref:DDE Tnp4 domain-containing protein n=1 Tax=Aphanomyces astaci TaxID=112090 RepID=W4FPR3_APHAT|nr:hypothetical protein H257_14847 [Aphanomyces astaci]ETV69477.1 hypothetical protein H257_14847 [Aphanomyces astaci]|eukprot:XP_009841050.1 hypothetical protein H257_14847 [Aphanomyces astaci]
MQIPGDKHALDFRMKAPTFKKMVHRVLDLVEPVLYQHYVKPLPMTDQVRKGHVFSNFPSALYCTDVKFQPSYRPTGRFDEAKYYFCGKHKVYGLKLECSVAYPGVAVALSDHCPDSVSYVTMFFQRSEIHLSMPMKSPTELDMPNNDEGRQFRSVQPKRRPQGGFLTPRELERNGRVSSDRVLVENYFGHPCSLWKIMATTYKWNESKFDRVSRICCALTNANVSWTPLCGKDGRGAAIKCNTELDARDDLKQFRIKSTGAGQVAEWAVWLGKAFEEEPQDLEVLKKRLKTAIQFDTTILNPASRIGKMLDNLMRDLERDDQARSNRLASRSLFNASWSSNSTSHEKTSAPPATAVAAPSVPSKPRRSEGSSGSSSGPPRRAPAPGQDSAKYDRKKATCGESEHGQVGERAQQEGDQASRQRKQSLGREAKIEGIVSVTTTLLDTGSDVTLVTADLMKSLERAGVEVKVISPEPSVIQPNGSSTCPQGRPPSVIQVGHPRHNLWTFGLAWTQGLGGLFLKRGKAPDQPDELLSHSFVKQEVWDVSNVDKWPPQATSAVMTACTVPPPTSKSHMLKTQKASETGGERWLKR